MIIDSGLWQRMIQGFNHNIKYRGIVFHIQTEDYGVKLSQIITHVFVGGNIIVTLKSSYADVHNAAQMKEVIRQMMEHQHKEVLKKLVSGTYEREIERNLNLNQQRKDPDEESLIELVKNQVQDFSPHLSKDQQSSILATKDDLKDTESTLDQLILSFLENE